MSAYFTVSGSFKNLFRFLRSMKNQEAFAALEQYGQEGVSALSAYTPIDTGRTGDGWFYEIVDSGGYYSIQWSNNHVNQGYNIAILLQFGHGTGTGGYVLGRDYINPAIQPVFDRIADKVWKAVTSA